MRFEFALVAVVLLGVVASSHGEEHPEGSVEVVKLGKHTFTLPAGFEIELVAGPPLVDRPIVADFDDEGHLYVADSAGVNDKVEKQLKDRPHRIVRLTDLDGDGVYDRSAVFADKMMLPEGLLWHDGAVYCAAPPSIWKLEDTDGDGVADRRTEWFNVGTLTGCANDLHGPYLGPAGWLYWTKGAFAKLDLELGDGSRLRSPAAHIFRARPDGTGLESFAAGGMDNPVDVTFGEAGDVFFSSTFLVHPAQGRRDGLIHSIYGSVYPKDHGVIDGLARTGELMPALAHLGPSASCGLETIRSGQLGEDFRGNLVSCLFNMRKVMRHRLVPAGATFRSEDSDFVVSDQVDFHPTDVQEDADGSLLVLDTGGWYKLCCPTSVIAKPEVLGAIYRVRRTEAGAVEDPRGKALPWSEVDSDGLVTLLNDPRPVVRDRATMLLARRGEDVLPELRGALMQEDHPAKALGALWALARIRTDKSAAVIRLALGHPLVAVRQAGAYVCGLERDALSLAGLVALLDGESLAVRREAASALGRLGKVEACQPLLGCASSDDRFLEHALVYALIEINAPDAVREAHARLEVSGAGGAASARRMLWALESMPGGQLRPEEAMARLRDVAAIVPILKSHPGWGAQIANHYEEVLREGGQPSGTALHLHEFLHLPEVGRMVSNLLLEGALPGTALRHLVESPHSSPLPDTLIPGLEKALLCGQVQESPLVHRIQPHQLTPRMEAWMRGLVEQGQTWPLKVLATCNRSLPDEGFAACLAQVGSHDGPLDAGFVLSRAKLSAAQKLTLAEQLPRAGVVELESLLKVYESGGSVELGRQLADALRRSATSRSVSEESFTKLAAAFPDDVQQEILDARPVPPGAAETAERLARMEASLPKGDRARGHQVFRSRKASCAACHRVGYDGGVIGPDLTRIGAIRSRRDLLEAILAPSASYARGYEPVLVTVRDGQTKLGMIQGRETDSLVLRDASGREEAIARRAITSVERAPVSIMPPGLEQNLSSEELADLIAFLESLK